MRKPEMTDAREIFNLRSSEKVNQYLDREPAYAIEDAVAFIKKIEMGMSDNKVLYWAICLKENPKVIGTVCFFDFPSNDGSAEIGFELLPFYHGKGIMQEALSIVIHFGFQVMEFKSIRASASRDNERSINLLKRIGFREEELLSPEKKNEKLARYVLPNKEDQMNEGLGA